MRATTLLMGALLGVQGCSSPEPSVRVPATGLVPVPVPAVAVSAEVRRAQGLGRTLQSVPAESALAAEALAAVADHAVAWANDPAVRRAVVEGIRGREREFFEGLFARAAREVTPLTPLLEAAAAAVGSAGGDPGRLAVVREVSDRGCCMRRDDLTAALRGLAQGMEGVAAPPVVQAEAVLRLAGLCRHPDPGVVAAAQGLGRFFLPPAPPPVEAPPPGDGEVTAPR